jgi:hypothetical protein
MENKGSVNLINKETANNNTILPNMAKVNPIFRTFARCLTGALLDMIDKNIILSIPKTTSRKTNVKNANQASGNKNKFIV